MKQLPLLSTELNTLAGVLAKWVVNSNGINSASGVKVRSLQRAKMSQNMQNRIFGLLPLNLRYAL